MVMVSADPRSLLGEWCRTVAAMAPGQYLSVAWLDLADIALREHNGVTFTAADRILGNIVGAAYTHSYEINPNGKGVTFIRHADNGTRRYEAPDKRGWWRNGCAIGTRSRRGGTN